MLMRTCVDCCRKVKPNFNYYCQRCYSRCFGKVKIWNVDFETYINHSFRTNYKVSDTIRFRDIYNDLVKRFPDLVPLANILENIVYLKTLGLI